MSELDNPIIYKESELHGAGFWIRALARIIDLLIHNGVSLIVGAALAIIAAIAAVVLNIPYESILLKIENPAFYINIAALLGATFSYALSEGLHGSTAGKMICGLVVIKENEEPCTLKPAIGRSFAFFIDSLFFGAIAAGKMSETHKKQRFGDKWAKTMVVKRKDLDPAQLRSGGRFALVLIGALFLDFSLILTAYLVQLFS